MKISICIYCLPFVTYLPSNPQWEPFYFYDLSILLLHDAFLFVSFFLFVLIYAHWIVNATHFPSIMYTSLSASLCLAVDDSELPLLFISIKFIRLLITVAHVGGGDTVRSAAISQWVFWVLSCFELHSGENWPFIIKRISKSLSAALQGWCDEFLWKGMEELYEKLWLGREREDHTYLEYQTSVSIMYGWLRWTHTGGLCVCVA